MEDHALIHAISELIRALSREQKDRKCSRHDPWSHLPTRHDLREVEERILDAIKADQCCPQGKVRFHYGIGLVTNKTIKKGPSMDIKITNEQKVTVTLKPVTDAGKPAKLDGSPAWTVISGNSSVTVSDDGLSAVLTSSDDPGDTEIMVKADADLSPNTPEGGGIEEISDIIKLSVVAATAKNLGLVAGTPEPK